MRALFKKCVRHSVCQRAVSARRALTGLSANHVRVKQHHVCQSANCCAVSAGKGFLPWYVFSFASRPIYFTPSQCPAPLPLNVPVYLPESVGIYVFNDIVNGNYLSLIIPVPWAFQFLPIISLMPPIFSFSGTNPFVIVLHVFSDSANWLFHLVITPVLGFCPSVLHVFSDFANWLIYLVITQFLVLWPNVRFVLVQLIMVLLTTPLFLFHTKTFVYRIHYITSLVEHPMNQWS